MKHKTPKDARFRKIVIAFFMVLAFCSGFLSHTLLTARAEEKRGRTLNRYYTSVQIHQGDSLWDLAELYRQGSDYSSAEYVEELKRMNGLHSEQIHSGEYLTVVYFAE